MADTNNNNLEASEIVQDDKRNLRGALAVFITLCAVGLSLFQLYTAGIAPLTAMYQRSIHLVLIMILGFALNPPTKGASRDRFDIYLAFDCLLIILAIVIGSYIWIEFDAIVERQGD
ncbi:MAG TPA: hypothetical protein PLS62_15190, partial [Desulfobacteraceae bacterium]|nr:hypothetical protein [Desulfobacteraceae bacterium]